MVTLAVIGIASIIIPEYNWYFRCPGLTRPELFWAWWPFYTVALVTILPVRAWQMVTRAENS